jgi:glutamine amidotransferase
MKALIVNYGMGNVASVKKTLDFIGIDSVISNFEKDFEESDFIILPGVGSFKQGMENLRKLNLINILNTEILLKKKPFLGICLGMQLIAQTGTENGLSTGLGWVEGEVIKIQSGNLRIPHLGWNNLIVKNDNFLKSYSGKDFYFIHSYHFDVTKSENIAAMVNYGKDYVAAVQKNNIFATQFHPEKSQEQGINLLKSFFNKSA